MKAEPVPSTANVCSVCDEPKTAGQIWFLLLENAWEDKLRVLLWDQCLAAIEGAHCACCPAHVRELVTHWMTMGTLDYPFADSGFMALGTRRRLASFPEFNEPDARGAKVLGEMTVHRERMALILEENPEPLQIILDELSDTLERAAIGRLARFESAPRSTPAGTREI